MTNDAPSRALVRTRFKLATVVFALITSAACAPQNAGTNGVSKPQDGIPGPPEAMPGRMDDYVQQIDFGAGAAPDGIFEGPLKCAQVSRCGGQTEVRLRIVPSNYAPSADWEKALNNGNGYVVAKVANLDAVPFDRFNLAAYEVAYLWVGATQGQARTAALYAVRGGTVRRVFTFPARRFCRNSDQQKPAVHIYSPAKCTEMSATLSAATVQRASIAPFGALATYLVNALTRSSAQPPALDGLWISCSLGCCEAQFDGVM
jgi:hypothetical protein